MKNKLIFIIFIILFSVCNIICEDLIQYAYSKEDIILNIKPKECIKDYILWGNYNIKCKGIYINKQNGDLIILRKNKRIEIIDGLKIDSFTILRKK